MSVNPLPAQPTAMVAPAPAANARPRPRLRRAGLPRELLNSLFFIVAALILSEMAFPRSSIDGPSMEPTLFTGQHLLISRLHYLFGEPQHGDIAVFISPADGEMLIKRIIATPGDTLELRDREFYLNGQRLEEPYFVNRPCRNCSDRQWQIGENEYFFVGDNRNRSNDSRSFSAVPRTAIIGKALFRYFPLDQIGGVE